jgi:hypothetical protein
LIVGLQQQTLPHPEILLLKTLFFHIETFTNTLGSLLMGRLTIRVITSQQEMAFKYT